MEKNIQKVLLSEETIQARLNQLAASITHDIKNEELVVIILLKGAFFFAADLCRRLPLPLRIECLNVSSYGGQLNSSGSVTFLDRKLPEVKGKNVLLLDDILDTGRTLNAVSDKLLRLKPNALTRCVLLSKDKIRDTDAQAEYIGFTIGDEFVVGYGLDYMGLYRNLPYIGTLKKEALKMD